MMSLIRKRSSRARLWIGLRYLWRRKAIWLRVLLCLGIGFIFIYLDENTNFDLRFRLRGAQNINPQIILIDINQNDWINYHGRSRNLIRPLKEISSLTDSFFWNEKTWQRLITQVLLNQPRAIGVTFYFGDSITYQHEEPQSLIPFFDERVIWASSTDSVGRTLYPSFSSRLNFNTGLNTFHNDDDGVVRRFSTAFLSIPHLSQRLAFLMYKNRPPPRDHSQDDIQLINFQGKSNSYPRVNFRDVLEKKVPPELFRNKIVLIGGESVEGHIYRTPVGELSRSELTAEITDNIVNNRWVKKPSVLFLFIYLSSLLIISIWIQFGYPQSIAFVFTVWLGTGATAFSLWVFDTFYISLPLQATWVQLGVTYIVFLSYHLTVKENMNWRLEQEKIYLTEVDQLKHNFVSLFSHDLKTPIAKIQAICDRLLTTHKDLGLRKDLLSLRQESSELHKYIEKILQISRVESREIKIHKEAADINEIILEVIDQLKPLASEKSIYLDTKLEPMFLVEIDSILIREVILNLIENAIKYTPKGGLVLINSREENNLVYVAVIDNGVGIASMDQQRVFDKFVRGQHQEIQTKGTGLGLYLVKYFVELHGGSVVLESKLNQGTKIEFHLPLENLTKQEMLGLEKIT